MVQKLFHLDFAAIVILVIVLISQFTRKMNKGTTNRVFIALVAVSLLSGCFEIWADVLDNIGCLNYDYRRVIHSLQMLVYNTITPCFLMYVMSLTCAWHKLAGRKTLWVVLALPYVVDITLIIANMFTGIIFDYYNGIYTINPLAYITYVAAGIYLAAGVAYIIACRRLFTAPKIIGLLCQLPIAVIAAAVIPMVPNSCVNVFAGALGVLLMAVLIQRPEELIDTFTGLRKYSSYADDMKKYYLTHNPVSVILVNVSNYSSLHKILGFDKMNELLVLIGKRLEDADRAAGAHSSLYYLDQGRFRLVMNASAGQKAEKAAELINDDLKHGIKFEQYELNIIAYVCLVRCPKDIPDFRSLISFGTDFHNRLPYNGEVIRADGKTIRRMLSLITGMDGIIDRAFANHGFHVYYQPIYSIEEKRFVSAEALLRLIDEKEGFISPEIFIPEAEKSGAIHRIGDFVLEEVCRFIGSEEFRKLGLDYIEINLSVSQCMQHGLADKVLGIMKKYGVSPDQVNLEITETAASYDQNIMSENLTLLNSAGISFSLDDYGTGYSNMYRIAALPLKIVKLDKTFVNNQNSKMWTILQNTVRMIKDLNMEIVVEGIETEDMVKKFSDLHCDFIQGYYYSKPIPEKEFVEFVYGKNKAAVKS